MRKIFIILCFLVSIINQSAQEINISTPNSGYMLPNNNAVIRFYSDFEVDLLTIEYSVNLGKEWETVNKSGYGLGDGELFVTWLAPDTLLTDCILRILKADDPTIGDTSEPFVLYPVEDEILENNELTYIFSNDGGNIDGRLSLGFTDTYGSLVYKEGLLFGGLVNNEKRVTGTAFFSSMMPGRSNQSFSDAREFRIWNFRTDWQQLPEGKEKEELKYEYENWPVDLGAPYNDKNNDGKYTPYIDSPKEFGDEYAWFLMNDSNDTLATWYYKSNTIGLQISCITYIYHNDPSLENTFFRKYLITNKGEQIDDFIIGYFNDFDIGSHRDDYVGCDTTLNLGFGYNAEEVDVQIGVPPAIGYTLLYGPIVESVESDSAIFNGKWVKGKKNLDLTSFSPMFRYNYDYIVEGSNKDEWYNNLNGKLTRFDSYPIDPFTGLATKFPLAGDPNTQTGWYEGEGWPDGPAPYDRRFMINTGNITFNDGDTLDIAYAIIISDGNDRLNSLKLLKEKTQHIRDFYFDTITKVNYNEEISPTFSLSQNYPNPFNPTTTIKFTLPNLPSPYQGEGQRVRLIVYDILGRRVKTLVNEVKSPGNYEVQFNASNLASGVYFYRLTAGDFVQTNKMILLR